MLTREQGEHYQRDGYLVLPGFKSLEEIARLRARAGEIVEAFDPRESRAVFTTPRPGPGERRLVPRLAQSQQAWANSS